ASTRFSNHMESLLNNNYNQITYNFNNLSNYDTLKTISSVLQKPGSKISFSPSSSLGCSNDKVPDTLPPGAKSPDERAVSLSTVINPISSICPFEFCILKLNGLYDISSSPLFSIDT